MKKLICLLLGIALCLGCFSAFVACGGGKKEMGDAVYPEDPQFNALNGFGVNNVNTHEANSHDPVVIEADGKYYSFNTDNYGAFGYTVRESEDLIHWNYVGVAIEGFGENAADVQAKCKAGTSALQEVYDILSTDSRWDGSCWTLWAPEVTPAKGGGYWLYGSWTSAFGSPHSIIFQCYADEVTGPYEFVDIIVYSYDGGGSWPNAIDASIYYDEDGNMYMAYGSFSNGIYSIELNPKTGLRADGLKGDDLLPGSSKTAAERYGTSIMANRSMEGPVIAYHEVSLYDGDVKNFDKSAVTTEGRYYLMGSANDLSSTYNMRSYWSTSPTEGFTSLQGSTGTRASGSFSWRLSAERAEKAKIGFDFFAPGHNDLITTSDGKNIIAYHNRLDFGQNNHYLFTSLYSFNSRGDLVISPNRYAGETEGKIDAEDITSLSDGNYNYALVTNNSYKQSDNGGYARTGMKLLADNTIAIDGENAGEWYLYGDNWVYIELDGVSYYGVALPAWIEYCDKAGLTITAVSENGADCLYMNMNW